MFTQQLSADELCEKFTPLMRSTVKEILYQAQLRGLAVDEDEVESDVQYKFVEMLLGLNEELGLGSYLRGGFNQLVRNRIRDLKKRSIRTVSLDKAFPTDDDHPEAKAESGQTLDDYFDEVNFPKEYRRLTKKFIAEGRSGLSNGERLVWYREVRPLLQDWWDLNYGDGEDCE